MTKTLSEQLCKICGIVPLRMYTYDKKGEMQTYLKYPDFTNSENFVKLLEIMTDETIKEKLSRIVRLFRVESGDLVYGKKQAIRKADWDWE